MKNILILSLLLISFTISSIEVNRDLIEIELDLTVEFENYVGPHLFYNSVEDIRAIGTFLAQGIVVNRKSDADYSGKYVMYHRPKLEWEHVANSCDIFQITSSALIDNIVNIELILSQFLIDRYGYSIKDADLLAHLLVIYNAVNRGNVAHIAEFYTSEGVITEDHEFLGLDLQYFNWPGKTYIYIPLSDRIEMGRLTNIDSDILTDQIVIDSIKLNDEEDIKLREDIIEFKEREYDEVSQDVKELERDISTNESLEINEENVENTEEHKEELSALEEDLVEKEEKILELRDDLSEDKNSLLIANDKLKELEHFLFILNRDIEGVRHGQVVDITENGDIITRGSVNSIRNSDFIKNAEDLYVIAGGDSANQFVTLGRISSKTLTVTTWGKIPCYQQAPVIIYKEKLYTIVEQNGLFYIGEFDLDLNFLRRSAVNLVKESSLLLKSETFYIQGKNNSIKLANLSDFILVE